MVIKQFGVWLCVLLALSEIALTAQVCPTYTLFEATVSGTVNVNSGSLVFSNTAKNTAAPLLRERNRSATLSLKLDLGNDYVKKSSGWNFKVVLDLTYQFNGSSAVAKTLTLTQQNPEVLKQEDVLAYFNSGSPTLTVNVTGLTINDGATPTPAALTGLVRDFVTNNLRLTASLVREYDVDVRLQSNSQMAGPPAALPVSIAAGGRQVTFSWTPGVTAYPNYELQVLKLYNTDPTYQDDANQINAMVDWQKALSVETQSWRNSITLHIGEGSGYYIWRVRPIGNYFGGASANSENYGEWSVSGADQSTLLLNKNTLTGAQSPMPYAFFFTDPDENINWSFQRVFTEGDHLNTTDATGVKASEGITYADGLLNVRQDQKYNSSENRVLVSQVLTDYSGRAALNVMPVPVDGTLSGYKPRFVQNSAGGLYTALDFDAAAGSALTLVNPGTVLSTTTAYSYYSNNTNTVNNAFVPDGQGYLYSRTLYKSDGSGRVEEEAGVGPAHSLAGGKTTRVQYELPSDEELIMVFGEEAPYAEAVLKTITTDANNVRSVTYTSKEGKVIATCLTSTSAPGMAALTRTAAVLTFTRSNDENVAKAGGSIISSNRIAVQENGTLIKLKYMGSSGVAGSTLCPTGDCNMRLRFFLADLRTGVTYLSDADNLAGQTDFTVSGGSFSFPSGWRFVSESNTQSLSISPSGGAYNEITLNQGEYILGKELFSSNKPGYVDSMVNVQNDKFRPVLEALAARMQTITSTATYTAFMSFLAALKSDIDNYRVGGGVTTAALIASLGIDPLSLPVGYVFPTDFTLAATSTTTNNPETDDLKITTGCCGTLKVPMPRPGPCYACEGSPEAAFQSIPSIATMTAANAAATATAYTPYGFDDFRAATGWESLSAAQKRAAIYTLVDREFIQLLKYRMAEEGMDSSSTGSNDLWKVAAGFSYHSLNFMLSNMLISHYYTGAAASHTNGVWYAASPLAAGGYTLSTPVVSLTPGYNYECRKLYEAWVEALELINGFELSGDVNLVNEFNDQGGDNSMQNEVEDDDNWTRPKRKLKAKLKKSLSDETTDFAVTSDAELTQGQQESLTNLPSVFLEYAGYQFAAIIDGSPLPVYISASATPIPDDYVSQGETPFGSGFYATVSTGSISNTYVPHLFSVNNGSVQMELYTCNGNSYQQLYYPYIVKPEWMFKYYTYNVFENTLTASPAINFISDYSTLLPHQIMLDLDYYYNSPYSYLPSAIASTLTAANLCKTRPASTYTLSGVSYTMPAQTHLNWAADERLSFYQNIGNAPRCYATKGLTVGENLFDPSGEVPECATKAELINEALDRMSAVGNALQNKRESIRNALIAELSASCYTIVACKTGAPAGIVSEADVNMLADAVIAGITSTLGTIANNITGLSLFMPPSNTVACSAQASLSNTYSTLMCDMPGCAQEDCKEILLFRNNTISVTGSRKLFVKLFADCDEKFMTMIEVGDFLPKIPPLEGCSKAAKSWDSCGGVSSCGSNYGEKTSCPPSNYETYSKTYSVSAGN